MHYFHCYSDCTDIQLAYHNISSKLTNIALGRMKEIITKTISSCDTKKAWDETKPKLFKRCTEEISASNKKILDVLGDIEKIAANSLVTNKSIDVQLEELMEDIDLNPLGEHSLDLAIGFLQSNFSRWSTCVLVYFSWLLNHVIYIILRRE